MSSNTQVPDYSLDERIELTTAEQVRAISNPLRTTILGLLHERAATVTELAEPFSISLPAISRHLKVLQHAGLISRSRSGQWLSSTLEAAPLKEATDWMERYRQFWDASFDRLDAHLRRIQQARDIQQARGPADGTKE